MAVTADSAVNPGEAAEEPARFADTVQGLSTLKVYGRQHRAAASIEQVTGDYRRETMRVRKSDRATLAAVTRGEFT